MCLFLLLYTICLNAQVQWPSPETEQMYNDARQRQQGGDTAGAIKEYRQLIQLAPEIKLLYRELGNTLYTAGRYQELRQMMDNTSDHWDEDVPYFILRAGALVQARSVNWYDPDAQYNAVTKQEAKAAQNILKKGLEKYPYSGELYHMQGIACDREVIWDHAKMNDALSAWLSGIRNDPVFADNYYDAAMMYFSTSQVMWGLLYGEMFLAMAHDTTRDRALKRKLFEGYTAMYDSMAKDYVPGRAHDTTFAGTVQSVYAELTPVIRDGITTETITMLHVRFLMEWLARYDQKYPFSFFTYQNDLVKNGRFDVYHEWMYGAVENEAEYNAWNTFHEGDMQRFLRWRSAHYFVPVKGEFYGDENVQFFKKWRKR